MELSGLKRTATRCVRGKVSLSSSSRFALSSGLKVLHPVIFPPGRDRLATKPKATGSPLVTMTIGIVVVAFLASADPRRPSGQDDVNVEANQFGCQLGRRSNFPSAQRDSMTILAFQVTQVTQACPQRFHPPCVAGSGGGTQETDPNDLRRLRLSHNSTEGEYENDSENHADFRFSILDFTIIGLRTEESNPQ